MKNICTPEKILPSGDDFTLVTNPFTGHSEKARKGTVAATLNNLALLNQLLSAPNVDSCQVYQIKDSIIPLLPSLKAIGIFDFFSLEEWINCPQNHGRIYISLLYLKQYPSELTKNISNQLTEIKQVTNSKFLRVEIEEYLFSCNKFECGCFFSEN